MGFDSRYPHLHRVKDAPGLSHDDKREACAIAKRIGDSTGLSCAYNARTGELFFYYGSPHGGPFAVPFKEVQRLDSDGLPMESAYGIGTRRKYTDEEIGDYIVLAKYGQLDKSEKDGIAEKNRKEEAYRHRVMVDKHTDERAPSMKDYAAFRDKKRRGTTKVVSV